MNFDIFIFLIFLLPFLYVRKVPGTIKDYFKGRQILNSWYISLSAVATNHSAFVYLGQIGFTYTYGLESLWLTIGWKLGDWFSMLSLQPRLRLLIKINNIYTLSELVNIHENRKNSFVQVFFGIISIFGLVMYASAQLTALYKLMGFFQIDYKHIILLSVLISIFFYLNRGGFDASVKTDTFQAFVLFLSISIMFYYSVKEIGGFFEFFNFIDQQANVNQLPNSLYDSSTTSSIVFFVFGWLVAGAGTISQPHILMRFMASKDQQSLRSAQWKYIVISSLFSLPILGIAMVARAMLPPESINDPELAMLVLAQNYFPHILVVILVLGITSAVMSTLDSLVIAQSTIVVKDIAPALKIKNLSPRLGTLIVLVAVYLYWLGDNLAVFNIILSSWSLVASIYFPMIILLLAGVRIKATGVLYGAITAVLALYYWRVSGFNFHTYELFPAMVMFFMAYFGFDLLIRLKGKFKRG